MIDKNKYQRILVTGAAGFIVSHLVDYLEALGCNVYSSYQKAKQLLNYEPLIDLEKGIREMIKWAKEIGWEQPVYLEALELENDSTPKTWKEKLI